MKEVFQQIWDRVFEYQDKRDDEGHAACVVEYAHLLLKTEKVDENIVIPAAIMHDIGWSVLPKEDRMSLFSKDRSPEGEKVLRLWHQEEGVKLAKQILEELEYPKEFHEHILEIISQHDTREGFFSAEDGIMRDADKLWRFDTRGFTKDMQRFDYSFHELYNRRLKNIDTEGFFYSERARDIAREELAKRKEEYVGKRNE